jgi:hypothetical protein
MAPDQDRDGHRTRRRLMESGGQSRGPGDPPGPDGVERSDRLGGRLVAGDPNLREFRADHLSDIAWPHLLRDLSIFPGGSARRRRRAAGDNT